jgi:hypothetical protein
VKEGGSETDVAPLAGAVSVGAGSAVVKLDMFDHVPYTPLEDDNACTSQ